MKLFSGVAARKVFLAGLFAWLAVVAKPNVYDAIKVQGAKRLSPPTIVKRLPFGAGQTVTDPMLERALNRLYHTGLFEQVGFYRDGKTLVLQVKENPTIADIRIQSGGEVSDDKLLNMLAENKISKGQIFNPNMYHQLQQALTSLYQSQGFHNVQVKLKTQTLPGSKVALTLHIEEGKEGKVVSIEVRGNTQVPTHDILGVMSLNPRLWSFLTGNNKYAKAALQDDLNAVRHLYYERGYLQAKILSHRTFWQGDQAIIKLNLSEGHPFYIANIALHCPKQVHTVLQPYLGVLKRGVLYDHKTVQKVVKRLHDAMAAKGYAFVNVMPKIQLRPVKHQVDLRFEVQLGRRVMVRRIGFVGNDKTQDQVLRREVQQLEASQYNDTLIQRSERRLNNLGYLKEAHCVPKRVAGRADLVDLMCHVEEVPGTLATASVGYSSKSGVIYAAKLDQKNFLGSGRRLTTSAEKSDDVLSANFDWEDPYFLGSNYAGRFHLSGKKIKNVKGSTAKYQTNVYEIGYDVGVPVSGVAKAVVGLSYHHTDVVKYDTQYPYIKTFIDQHGKSFNTTNLHLGWQSNTYDRFLFPSHGVNQNVSVHVGLPMGSKALTFYKLDYKASWYHPLFASGWTSQWMVQLGYGHGYGDLGKTLPFFKNYWAGGEGTIRGFETNTLGPKDTLGKPMGGNLLAVTGVNVFTPPWLGDDKRLGFFVDAGNVFKDHIQTSEIRASAGLVLQWRTPLAPISLSLGYPIRKKQGDERHAFSFALSTSM